MSGGDGFEAFFDQDFLRLVLFLVKHGASEAEAEDAAQQAMVDAWRDWQRIDSPRAWVRTVALRAWWKRKTGRDWPLAALAEDVPLPGGEDPAIVEEGKWKVVRLLNRLPPRQRAVAAWYYDGFGVPEIGQRLGMTEPTVRSHLRHARRRLKEMIESEGGFGSPACPP